MLCYHQHGTSEAAPCRLMEPLLPHGTLVVPPRHRQKWGGKVVSLRNIV